MVDLVQKIAADSKKALNRKAMSEMIESTRALTESEADALKKKFDEADKKHKRDVVKLLGVERCDSLNLRYGRVIFQYIACSRIAHDKEAQFIAKTPEMIEDAVKLEKEFGLKIINSRCILDLL